LVFDLTMSAAGRGPCMHDLLRQPKARWSRKTKPAFSGFI
jgi:hypothetical protein